MWHGIRKIWDKKGETKQRREVGFRGVEEDRSRGSCLGWHGRSLVWHSWLLGSRFYTILHLSFPVCKWD